MAICRYSVNVPQNVAQNAALSPREIAMLNAALTRRVSHGGFPIDVTYAARVLTPYGHMLQLVIRCGRRRKQRLRWAVDLHYYPPNLLRKRACYKVRGF
jgi:hypothetical protein